MLVEDEAEQRALADMREMRDAGTSLRTIATQIEQTHGIQISHQGVKRVLSRSG
jgi:intein-encoded DNA endonuclease-like protein